MPTIHDDEFGKITIRRSAKSRSITMRVAPDGSLRASLPIYAPILLVRRMIKSSRNDIRLLIEKSQPKLRLENGMFIGKSHRIIVIKKEAGLVQVENQGLNIVISLPSNYDLNDKSVVDKIRPHIITALKKEAKAYLPRRLKIIAEKYGFRYEKVRFSHASSRWGSCSSNGTISLNIALMQLPFEAIDYVIIHELSHTVHMNHSEAFWNLVYSCDNEYRKHRKILKLYTPTI